MPRNMSFSMTTQQVYDRTKTVTRRFGWAFLKPGDVVNAVEKAMGLKKGEKVVCIAQIRIISNRREPLNAITKEDCVAEGFPEFEPGDFVAFLCQKSGNPPDQPVNRIEFEYI